MRDLHHEAFGLFVKYEEERLYDPLDPDAPMAALGWMYNKSYRIRVGQIMFALAYQEFGDGNQEAFFRLVQEYNKTNPDGEFLGPKRNTSTKSLRAYLKKGQARIQAEVLGIPTFFHFIWYQLFCMFLGIVSKQIIVHLSPQVQRRGMSP